MFLPESHTFCFARRRRGPTLDSCGVSVRYGAIVALGAARLDSTAQTAIFGGETAQIFCDRLIDALPTYANAGDVALLTWAAARLQHVRLPDALARLRTVLLEQRNLYTVEAAWALSAFSAAHPYIDVQHDVPPLRERLLRAYHPAAGLFAHATGGRLAPRLRAHVACFADQVYPIQALALHALAFADETSLRTAARCAEQICSLQGAGGQWWWHYDVRTGRVVEGYPVYSVHQDSMAPMALLDLLDAGGPDCTENVRSGLRWLLSPPERPIDLLDDERGVIWRSIRRRGPVKGVRAFRAVLSGIWPGARLRLLDRIFVPSAVDWEDRPYHLGWILYTWLGR
jgi:hypothetical protein